VSVVAPFNMNKALSYQDVLLTARYSTLESRDLADPSVELCGERFKLPVIPANMQDVINLKIARELSKEGYFYIMHRFDGATLPFIQSAHFENWPLISISTGVDEASLLELTVVKLHKLNVHFITVDVAHGHHQKVAERIKWIKENLPSVKIIAGNVMTSEAVKFLECAGADVIKIGVGQGSICTTRFQTGFSEPMFTCIQECAKHTLAPIIADGGIQYPGDIAKALVAGALMVMSGKLFAPCIDSPAKIDHGKKFYRGSTSLAAKKTNKHIEGITLDLEPDITIAERLQEIKEALQSAISYAGGNTLAAFQGVPYTEIK
jgi:GMP reductase